MEKRMQRRTSKDMALIINLQTLHFALCRWMQKAKSIVQSILSVRLCIERKNKDQGQIVKQKRVNALLTKHAFTCIHVGAIWVMLTLKG